MSTQLEMIVEQVQVLSFEERIQLIKRIADTLAVPPAKKKGPGLVYGKYRNTGIPFSTEADFQSAEWHSTEKDLNGDRNKPGY